MNKKIYICTFILLITILFTSSLSAGEPDRFRLYKENPPNHSERDNPHNALAAFYEAIYSIDEVFTLGEEYIITKSVSLTDDGTWPKGSDTYLTSFAGTVTIEGKYDIYEDIRSLPILDGTITYETIYYINYLGDEYEQQFNMHGALRIDNNGDWAQVLIYGDQFDSSGRPILNTSRLSFGSPYRVKLDGQVIPAEKPDEEVDEKVDEEDLWLCYNCHEEIDKEYSHVGFSDLYGEVYVITTCPLCDDVDFYFAELNAILYMGDMIETRSHGGAVLSLRDMTTFITRPGSIIRIDDTSGSANRLSLLMGHVWVNVKRMLDDGTLDVEMSQAIAGARGTVFSLEETGDKSILRVMRGAVEITMNSGESHMVYEGQMIEVTEDGTSGVETFSIDEEIASWPEELREEITASLTEGRKSFLPLAIVLIIAACFGGYLYYRKKSERKG